MAQCYINTRIDKIIDKQKKYINYETLGIL